MSSVDHFGKCPKCDRAADPNQREPFCLGCFEQLPEGINRKLAARSGESGKTRFLRLLAFLNLIGSIITAFYIGTSMGKVTRSVGSIPISETNPLAVALIIFALAEGVIGCVFLLVVAETAEYVNPSIGLLRQKATRCSADCNGADAAGSYSITLASIDSRRDR